MIKLQKYTPDVYYEESRDFQYIGRLYDLVLNYSKTNVDLLYNLPLNDNTNEQFIELLSFTLGFKPRHKYLTSHLRAICSCLSEILKNKGTIKAITLACNAIIHAEGITEKFSYSFDPNKIEEALQLYLPAGISSTTLLTDLFDYIIPAGISTNIVKCVTFNENAITTITSDDIFTLWTSAGPDTTNTRHRAIENVNGKDVANYEYSGNIGRVTGRPELTAEAADRPEILANNWVSQLTDSFTASSNSSTSTTENTENTDTDGD